MIFRQCPDRCFDYGLEIGAGDGFQTQLIKTYIEHLVCTELNNNRIDKNQNKDIEYKICDAECISDYFNPESFDLIFSSLAIIFFSPVTS